MIEHHPEPFKSYPELQEHIKSIKEINGVAGISHHDEIFKLPVGSKADDESTDEEMRMEEDAKIKAALEEKLKRVREEKERERLLTQQDGGSPVLTTRKRRKLAARKNGWDHETFNQYAGTPPEEKNNEKPDTPMTDIDKPDPPFNPKVSPSKSEPPFNPEISPPKSEKQSS